MTATTPAPYPAFDGSQVCAQADPEEFFPDLGESVTAAKAICKGDGDNKPCDFLNPCLQYALHHQVSGVWGGTSGIERRNMRRKLGIVAAPLSFGTGPTNATTVKRMASQGASAAHIAEHLGITTEAVHRILRSTGAAGDLRVECEECGKRLLPDSMAKHQRTYCPSRLDVA